MAGQILSNARAGAIQVKDGIDGWIALPSLEADKDKYLKSNGEALPEWATLPKFAGISEVTFKLQAADQIVNNSNVLVNSTDMVFPMAANSNYYVKLFLRYHTTVTASIKFGFTAATATRTGYATYLDNAGALQARSNWAGDVVLPMLGNVGFNYMAGIMEIILLNGAAGNFQLQFAQNAAEVFDTKLRAGSLLMAYKLG